MTRREFEARLYGDFYRTMLPYPEEGAADYDAKREAWAKDQRKLERQFVRDMFAAFKVTGNRKARKVYEIAYDFGHAHGYEEIYVYFSRIVPLIK